MLIKLNETNFMKRRKDNEKAKKFVIYYGFGNYDNIFLPYSY